MDVRCHAGLVPESGKGAAERVRSGCLESIGFERKDEGFWSQGHSARSRDLVLASPEGSQLVERAPVDRDGSDARPCLRSFDLDPRSTDHDGLVDTDPLAIHVHVRPPKCTCLSPSEARRCHQSNECRDPGIPRASDPQDRFDFVDTRRTDFLASLSEAPHREFGVGDGVRESVSTPLSSQPTGPMEDRPNAADPFLGKSRVLERPEVLLHVEWRQRCDAAPADRLLDMKGPHRLVVGGGIGRKIGPAVGLPRRDGVVDRCPRSPERGRFGHRSRRRLLFGHQACELPLCGPASSTEPSVDVPHPALAVPAHIHPEFPDIRITDQSHASCHRTPPPLVGFSVGFFWL